MSYYVKRTSRDDDRFGWVGPIRSHNQAQRERCAWIEAGWDAVVFDSTPEVRAAVREWQRAADIRLGRIIA